MDCSLLHAQRHKEPLERFREKFIPIAVTGCWLWTSGSRYGTFYLNGVHMSAHKAAWILYNQEPVPHGMYVLHKCDRGMCVNPDHLFLGTPQDNMDDKCRKGRHKFVRGERIGNSKLTAIQVLEIRMACEAGEKRADIAARYNIGRQNVNMIHWRKSWKHVDFAEVP